MLVSPDEIRCLHMLSAVACDCLICPHIGDIETVCEPVIL